MNEQWAFGLMLLVVVMGAVYYGPAVFSFAASALSLASDSEVAAVPNAVQLVVGACVLGAIYLGWKNYG